MCVFMPVPQCFHYCSFVVSFKIRKGEAVTLLKIQYCFVFLGSFRFCFYKTYHWDFDRACTEMVNCFGKFNTLITFDHTICKCWLQTWYDHAVDLQVSQVTIMEHNYCLFLVTRLCILRTEDDVLTSGSFPSLWEIPKISQPAGRMGFGSQFQSNHSMITWPHCSGPVTVHYIIMKAEVCSLHGGQGSRFSNDLTSSS